jgi:Bacterial SH3 domain
MGLPDGVVPGRPLSCHTPIARNSDRSGMRGPDHQSAVVAGMLRRFPALASMVAATGLAAAEPVPMAGPAIKDAIAGAVLHLDTPIGTPLPVRYAPEGQLSGTSGGLSFYLGSASDTGRWWIARDKLCHKWTKWFDAEPQCLKLLQDGSRLHWTRDDGKTGTATIVSRPEPVAQPVQTAAADPKPSLSKPLPPTAPPAATSLSPRMASLGIMQPTEKTVGVQTAPQAVLQVVAKPPVASGAVIRNAAAKAQSQNQTQNPPQNQSQTTARPASQSAITPALARVEPAKAQPAAPPPIAASTKPSFRVSGVDEDDVLNVRAGPSPDHTSIGTIPPRGTGLLLTGSCLKEWCPIAHRGTSGWVHRYYLTEEPMRTSAWLGPVASDGRRAGLRAKP